MLIATMGFCQSQAFQASTPEEFDAYLDVVEARMPAEVIAAARAMAERFPESELLAHARELEMKACRQLGDAGCVLSAGESILARAPRHAGVLVTLAAVLANEARDEAALARAEGYARRGLRALETFRVPKSVSLDRYARLRATLASDAHGALGHVAFKRGRIPEAIRELEAAVRLTDAPDPVHYYRLGLLYQTAGRTSEATRSLQQAAALGDPTLRRLAEEWLRTLVR
jgi:Flp pilus assembly protein TadD